MEILIRVPALFQPWLEWLSVMFEHLLQLWHQSSEKLEWISASMEQIFQLPRKAMLPIAALILVFWPVLFTLVVAMATASTWIFWLFTSILVGIVQLLYVTYQFLMISLDLMGLSILKAHNMMRRFVMFYVDGFAGGRGKSRRRLWLERLDDADSYEAFLKIRIEPKDVNVVQAEIQKKDHVDTALPPPGEASLDDASPGRKQSKSLKGMPRSNSFTDTSPTTSADTTASAASPPGSPSRIPRNRSFSGELKIRQAAEAEQERLVDPVVAQELGGKTAHLLMTTTQRLNEARVQAERSEVAVGSLKYLLSAVVKQNHLNLDDLVVENASSVALRGVYGLTQPSRQLIRGYYAEVIRCLDWIADSEIPESLSITPPGGSISNASTASPTEPMDDWQQHSPNLPHKELADRIMMLRKMKHNMGRAALMLSGGGAQAMLHMGVVRALVESKLYQDINVISGTSGGSIIAAMCAMKTADELYSEVTVPWVSTDFTRDGEQKRKNIRWFPTVMEMAAYWLKHRLLMDNSEFRRTCEFYYGELTFEEAFERTGKHVCITVSASRASAHTKQRLLLNHISTPHVTLASAVAASCALPGVMAPAKLFAKNSAGQLEPFLVDGVEWIDGSVQADLPFQRISTLFSVSTFIVSQTNFHVVPFLNKAHNQNQNSLYWRLFQTMEWDIRSRALKLSRLGLFPKIFGQDVSKVFKQKYHGNLTIVPRFTTMQTFGLNVLSNPSVMDMEVYIRNGQLATWPYLNAIRDMVRLEKTLDDCLGRLEDRMRSLHPGDWSSHHDDLDSIASSSNFVSSSTSQRVRIVGRPPLGLSTSFRETERMRQRMNHLEHENVDLKRELEELRKLSAAKNSGSGISSRQTGGPGDEEDKTDQSTEMRSSPLSEGLEGKIWSFVSKLKKP